MLDVLTWLRVVMRALYGMAQRLLLPQSRRMFDAVAVSRCRHQGLVRNARGQEHRDPNRRDAAAAVLSAGGQDTSAVTPTRPAGAAFQAAPAPAASPGTCDREPLVALCVDRGRDARPRASDAHVEVSTPARRGGQNPRHRDTPSPFRGSPRDSACASPPS